MSDESPPPPKRGPGRPRVPEHKQGYAVSTWLPSIEYDQIIKAARAHDMSVSAYVRAWMRRKLKTS